MNLMFQKKISLYRQMILMFLNALSLYKESAFVVQEMLENVTNDSSAGVIDRSEYRREI
jgi:hypothetical protein